MGGGGHHSGVPQLLKSGEQIEIGDLAPRDWELFVVMPARAPRRRRVGADRAARHAERRRRRRGVGARPRVCARAAGARVRTPGTFGAYCSEAPRLVRVGGAVVPFEYDASSGLLRVDVSDDAAEIAANAAAGAGEKQVRTAEVAVDFAFGARANLRLRQQPKRDDAPNTVEVTNVEVLNRIRSLACRPCRAWASAPSARWSMMPRRSSNLAHVSSKEEGLPPPLQWQPATGAGCMGERGGSASELPMKCWCVQWRCLDEGRVVKSHTFGKSTRTVSACRRPLDSCPFLVHLSHSEVVLRVQVADALSTVIAPQPGHPQRWPFFGCLHSRHV